MDEREQARLVFEAVHALGIDVPVMSSRIVGNRVELYLYGGGVKVYAPEMAGAAVDPAPPDMAGSSIAAIGERSSHNIADYNHPAVRDLEGMDLAELRDLAVRWKIARAGKLSRAKLIEKLRKARV